ncbi:MAG: sigma-70 family RNA polymerase sigma factor [Fuerstiella sp.]|nr:sigma-70 family RNA polymerase sigma factor [Fuerstiella sp.]
MSDSQDTVSESFENIFREERQRLWRLVRFRMNPGVRHHLDTEDVLQDVFIEASRRYDDYLDGNGSAPYLWLRQIALEVLNNAHRTYTGAQQRSTERESYSDLPANDAASSPLLRLVAAVTTPSAVAIRQETKIIVDQALQKLNETDWEVIQLRQFEELTNSEVAEVLEISVTAASIRYVRALERLKDIVESLPDFSQS